MKKLILSVIAAVVMSSSAFAEDSLKNYLGNTMHVMPKKGPVHRIYFNADGTYQGFFPDWKVVGTYKIVNGEVCMTPTEQNGQQKTVCHTFDFSKKVGDSWTLEDHGQTIDFRLEAGHV